jgi:adenylate kinase
VNILIFGPNGSGKGTQGSIVQKKYGVPHIETGVIFRQNISQKTPLGEKAKVFIDRGELVPDDITVPMILNRLKEDDCKKGWLLDGFPRNLAQAEALYSALEKEKMKLDYVIEIELERDIAKKRIMGRRLCKTDNNHPNNIYIEAIKPADKNGKMICRVCSCEDLTTRADDQDAAAIDKRHNIYYDTKTGTLAAVNFFKKKAKVISVDGSAGVKEVSAALLQKFV